MQYNIDRIIKNILWVAVIIAVLFVGYSSYIYSKSFSESIQPSSFRNFAVSADAKVSAVPDVASFTFNVITEGGKDIASLQNTNTTKVNKIIDAIKAKDVDAKDIKTQNYSVDPRYQYYSCNQVMGVAVGSTGSSQPRPCPPAEIVGYTINQSVSVKVRDFKKVGDVLSAATSNGANSVSQLSFTIDDPTKLENEAREQAINNAKEKADAVAKAGGFTLGKLLAIEEGGQNYPMTESYGMGMGASDLRSMAKVATPTIEPGSQEVKVSITLRYEIK